MEHDISINKGFTIVEMMIGMMIAMICVIILLMLFKQISGVAGTASRNAEYDAQLETGTLVIHKFVQNAGYGSGQAIDIIVAPVAPTPTPTTINDVYTQSLYWRIQPNPKDSTYQECYRIKETISQDASTTRDIHILTFAKKTSCGLSTDMKTITEAQWTTAPSSSETIMRLFTNHTTNSDNSLKAIFNYSIFPNCKPFGIQGIKSSKGVTIIAKRLDVESSNVGNQIERSVCLNNIP